LVGKPGAGPEGLRILGGRREGVTVAKQTEEELAVGWNDGGGKMNLFHDENSRSARKREAEGGHNSRNNPAGKRKTGAPDSYEARSNMGGA
jgi:hypothetical protein